MLKMSASSCSKKILLDYQALRSFKSWQDVFENEHSLKVELGCGKDDSLIQRAALEPSINFIGIENELGIAYRLEEKILKKDVSNLRVVPFDADFVLKNLLLDESVQAFYMQFPDPWPKRKHARRRMLTPDFVNRLWKKLNPGGEFFIATDVPTTAQLALDVIETNGGFINDAGDKLFVNQKPFNSLTLYEQKFLRQGLRIYYLRFRKSRT